MALSVNTYVAGSCALSSIQDLGSHKNPVEAMQQFCKLELSTIGDDYRILAAFYVFVAGPEVPGHGHSKPWVRYGTEFAEFLVNEKLGSVATLGQTYNLKHHKDTTCQVWIWKPDQKAVAKWWENNKLAPVTRVNRVAGSAPPKAQLKECKCDRCEGRLD